ncbi:MAG: magnesium transporter CorA family protein [Bdellovibrionales bacterium]
MITAYARNDKHVTASKLNVGDAIPLGTVWVDLLHPTEEERLFVLSALQIDLPDEAEMEEIEASSRLYVERQAVFLTTAIITKGDTDAPEMGDLALAVTANHLVTTRYCEPRSIDLFAFRLRKNPEYLASSYDVLLEMMDAVTDRLADLLQNASGSLDTLSQKVFSSAPQLKRTRKKRGDELTDVLRGIGQAGELTHKVRDCLNGLQRLLGFTGVQLLARFTSEQAERLKTVNRDIQSLMEAANTITYETGFLLDATLGFINIEQNQIIKIFSIAAVVFLPPTLVGTVYGMNFDHMPELAMHWGYPTALGLMLVSAILPIWYFRRQGWL